LVSFTPQSFYPLGKNPHTQGIGGWVDPRIGLEDVEKKNVCPYRGSKPDPSAVQPVSSRYTDYAIPTPCTKYWEITLKRMR
jgi:hypothetical protein